MDERSIKRLAVILLTAIIIILVFRSIGIRMATKAGIEHERKVAAQRAAAPAQPAPDAAPPAPEAAPPAPAPEPVAPALQPLPAPGQAAGDVPPAGGMPVTGDAGAASAPVAPGSY